MQKQTTDQLSFTVIRENDIQKMISAGISPYPHKFNPNDHKYNTDENIYKYYSTNVEDYNNKYKYLSNGQHIDNEYIYMIGRIYFIRKASKKLIFIDLHEEGNKVQVMANYKQYLNGEQDFFLKISVLREGDLIGVAGIPGKSQKGELSIIPHQISILAICKHVLPLKNYINEQGELVSGLLNQEIRYRQRYLDLIINEDNLKIFIKRSKIIKSIRRFLDDELKLYEVDTPILNPTVGGAIAKPFVSHSKDYDCPLFMRIAPELSLKMLIIGGFRGVYEVGKQFRNESNDLTHNCEFTSLEFYIQNHDYNDLMTICENLLSNILQSCNDNDNKYKIIYDGKQIDFTPPYKRLDMINTLEQQANIKLPDNLESDEALEFLDKKCRELGVECSAPRTTPRLLDKLVGAYVEPLCVNPTYITGHPQIMSPLAKWDRSNINTGLTRTERFELFINCTELANAYTELNDPSVQIELFKKQAIDKLHGDDEAMICDINFVTALEYGLIPTGGFGLGIDRLVMLLTGNTSIREIILFPTMKPITQDQNNTL